MAPRNMNYYGGLQARNFGRTSRPEPIDRSAGELNSRLALCCIMIMSRAGTQQCMTDEALTVFDTAKGTGTGTVDADGS